MLQDMSYGKYQDHWPCVITHFYMFLKKSHTIKTNNNTQTMYFLSEIIVVNVKLDFTLFYSCIKPPGDPPETCTFWEQSCSWRTLATKYNSVSHFMAAQKATHHLPQTGEGNTPQLYWNEWLTWHKMQKCCKQDVAIITWGSHAPAATCGRNHTHTQGQWPYRFAVKTAISLGNL